MKSKQISFLYRSTRLKQTMEKNVALYWIPRLSGHVQWIFSLCTIAFLLTSTSFAVAQTCSCAAPPILGHLESSLDNSGELLTSFSYTGQSIADTFSGSQNLNDQTIERFSSAYLLEISYAFTSAISTTVIAPYVSHERRTVNLNGRENTVTLRGLGDVMVVLKYNFIGWRTGSPQSLNAGLGIEAPTGDNNATIDGVVAAEDLQPGSGSWDSLLWLHFKATPPLGFTSSLDTSFVFRNPGTNSRGYAFGREWRMSSGVLFAPLFTLNTGLQLIYRHATADQRSGQEIPNTGGDWLDIEPVLALPLNNQFHLRLSGLVPLHRWVKGTQLSRTYALSLAFTYRLPSL